MLYIVFDPQLETQSGSPLDWANDSSTHSETHSPGDDEQE